MNRRGFSVVELLVAATILSVVLGLVATYFMQQSDMSRRTQARSEVQDKVRFSMQLVGQDLQMAGSSRYVTGDSGAVNLSVSLPSCSFTTCLEAVNAAGGANHQDAFNVRYITSLRSAAEACRDVRYRLSGNVLQRSDVTCGNNASFVDLADNVLALDVVYICSNGNRYHSLPDANCAGAVAYPRSAEITLLARSNTPVSGAPATTVTTASNQSVSCGPGFACFSLTQEVLMPNLKDN
jgi:prepilin-type N-terminal cleavage/methylation domain-containing protein